MRIKRVLHCLPGGRRYVTGECSTPWALFGAIAVVPLMGLQKRQQWNVLCTRCSGVAAVSFDRGKGRDEKEANDGWQSRGAHNDDRADDRRRHHAELPDQERCKERAARQAIGILRRWGSLAVSPIFVCILELRGTYILGGSLRTCAPSRVLSPQLLLPAPLQ